MRCCRWWGRSDGLESTQEKDDRCKGGFDDASAHEYAAPSESKFGLGDFRFHDVDLKTLAPISIVQEALGNPFQRFGTNGCRIVLALLRPRWDALAESSSYEPPLAAVARVALDSFSYEIVAALVNWSLRSRANSSMQLLHLNVDLVSRCDAGLTGRLAMVMIDRTQ